MQTSMLLGDRNKVTSGAVEASGCLRDKSSSLYHKAKTHPSLWSSSTITRAGITNLHDPDTLTVKAVMDRNGNFDYRNFFYPGPAPLPVQIYPVSGDPRFPFHFSPAGAPTNLTMTGGRRGDSASPLAGEDITAAEDAELSPPPPTGSSSNNNTVAKRDAAATASAPTTTPPVKLDHVVQGLSHLLSEAITFCEECLKTHKEVTAAAPFAGHATRNRLWRELLEARFEASGVHKDLLHSLVPKVRRYTAQAQQAVNRESQGGGLGGEEDGDEHYRLTLMADKLLAQCNWVAQINRKALGSSAACESMVETMREMMVLCGKIGGGEGDGQDGGGGGGY